MRLIIYFIVLFCFVGCATEKAAEPTVFIPPHEHKYLLDKGCGCKTDCLICSRYIKREIGPSFYDYKPTAKVAN